MRRPAARGFALVLVLLVLAALIAVATPFLLSMRSGDRIAVHRLAEARARLAVEGGIEHARRFLHDTHPSRDATPLSDGRAELTIPPISKDLFDARDPRGTILSVRAEDEQAKIHVNSAPPSLLAALFGCRAFLGRDLKPDEAEVSVDDASGLPEEGFVWIRNELIHYARKDGGRLVGCTRGVLSETGRYSRAVDHPAGALVLADRVRGIALRRVGEGLGGGWRPYETPAALIGVESVTASEPITRGEFERVEPLLTVWSDRAGAGDWTVPVRVIEVTKDRYEIDRVVRVANARDFGPGSTVRIVAGRNAYHGIVLDGKFDGGVVLLEEAVPFRPDAYGATMSALVRHPVNANVASREVLEVCLEGLRLLGGARSESITRAEARGLADRILAARETQPIGGLDDFVRRIVEPATREGAISESDAQAIFLNAENANDSRLHVSSLPFTFASGDAYALEASASINARSGVERSRLDLREVRAIRPQEDLLAALATQTAFDDHLRFTRGARHWMSGPRNTSMWDARNDAVPNVPPSRLVPSLGLAGEESQVFASDRPEESWVQPWPARRFETGIYQGRVEHFDFERTPEGRDPRETPALFAAGGNPVGLAGGADLLYPGSMEAWFRFDGAPADGSVLLDVGAAGIDRNRVSLLVEGTDLVFRAYDGGGEDSGQTFSTPDRDAAEVHLPISTFQPNQWYHLLAAFRGTLPSDLVLEVDGFRRRDAQTWGLTRLTADLDSDDVSISVESLKGFPTSGPFVVRIGGSPYAGGEIAEVRVDGSGLVASWTSQGVAASAYAGGRGARDFAPGGDATGYSPLASGGTHRRGEAVELYGYAATLASNLPLGGGKLSAPLGRFTVAFVKDITPPPGEPIQSSNNSFWGTGIYKTTTDWILDPVDSAESATFMDAFQAAGGYALVFQLKHFPSSLNSTPTTTDGDPICGVELVRYSGKQGNHLTVPASGRGISTARYPGNAQGLHARPHAFILHPGGGVGVIVNGVLVPMPANAATDPLFRTYVIPLSVGGAGVDATGTTYLVPAVPSGNAAGIPEYAQIYDRTNEALTEWIRYDEILENFFARTEPAALIAAVNASSAATGTPYAPIPPPSGSTPPGGPPFVASATSAAAPAPAPAQQGLVYQIGTREISTLVEPMSLALGFRGVHGTHSHAQPANADLIPVFRTSVGSGRPGRNDRVAVLEPGATGLPFRYTVNWAAFNAGSGSSAGAGRTPLVAFKEATGNLYAQTATGQTYESRAFTRLLKSPSGELPIAATRFAAGSSFDGSGGQANAIVDEVAFTTAAGSAPAYDPRTLGRMFLVDTGGIDDAQTTLRVSTNAAIFPHRQDGQASWNPTDALPADAGVLRIDDEWMIYRLVRTGTGEITITANGRGAFGSEKSAHGEGSPVLFLDHRIATQLSNSVTGAASTLGIIDAEGFPPEGTARVDDEMVHWTRLWNGGLDMPRRSEEPGADDGKGDGLFRGRFGTPAAGHSPPDSVVVLWPFRFWDRAGPRADAPELAFYEMRLASPDAWFRRLHWEEEIPSPALDVVALARVDEAAPWDADPAKTADLRRFSDPKDRGLPVAIDRQGSRLEVRFFAEYLPGAFDPAFGLADGWKSAPRLKTLVVDYLAPDRVLRREERRW